MDTLYLKHLSRQLIQSCDGQEKAASLCRLTAGRISVCLDDNHPGDFLPLDVVAVLEAECGEPIVSRALVDARPSAPEPADALIASMELAESAVIVMSMTRRSSRPPKLRERQELHQLADQVDRHARAFRASIAVMGPVAGGAA